MVRVAIGADHNGVALKAHLTERLRVAGYEVEDVGTSCTCTVDYPALCVAVCERVVAGKADVGVFVGGTGQGEVIACNKVAGIRAGVAYSPLAVEISRGHNDANVMVLGARTTSDEDAAAWLDLWLATPFKGGVHADRVDQLTRLDAAR